MSLSCRVAAIVLLLLAANGCRQAPAPTASRAVARGPREKFEEIKRRFDWVVASTETPIVDTNGEDGTVRLNVRFHVDDISYRLEEGEPPTAEVTVRITADVTLFALEEKASDAEDSNQAGDASLGKDPLLSGEGPQANPERHKPIGTVHPTHDQVEKTYQLAYENDRWVLKTEPDQEMFKLAFDYALDIP